MPHEVQRRPEATDNPLDRSHRDVMSIERSKIIGYYENNITDFKRPLKLDGYDPHAWDMNHVLQFENNLFIVSRSGKEIAGFRIIRTNQGILGLRKLTMSNFPIISSVLMRKFGFQPTPSAQRAEQARRKVIERQPEAHIDGSVHSVLTVLQSISIESGREKLSVLWPNAHQLAHYLRTNCIPERRYAQYVRNIRDHAELLSLALRSSTFRGNIRFDGRHLIATDGTTTLMTTATRVLIRKLPSTHFSTLYGNQRVFIRENATTTEYSIGTRRELHRRDGGLQLVAEGSYLNYYDGSNRTPIIAKRGEDIVISPDATVGIRPNDDPVEYGKQIAATLRTPEAIGAYVSQFYYGQDFRGNTSEHHRWLQSIKVVGDKPVRYLSDSLNVVQRWETTLRLGTGDCEDFALFAQGLLALAGTKSFVMMVNPRHYEAVFFEKAAENQYYVCTLGLRGFHRSSHAFSSLGEATKSLWEGTGSGAEVALRNPKVRAQFADPRDPHSYPIGAPGIFQLRQPADYRGNADMIEYSREEYFRQFVT